MKFATLTTALLSSVVAVAALPTSESGANTLTKRAAYCFTNSMQDRTTATSASVADCRALSSSLPGKLPQPWSPSADSVLEVSHGTCGLRAYLNAGSTVAASDVVISTDKFVNIVDMAIEDFATAGGKVGASGTILCVGGHLMSGVGHVIYEIYNAA
jgi:hypothetical protein